MNKFTRRYPNWCSGFENTEHSFETIDELFSMPYLKELTLQDGHVQFSLSNPEMGQPLLMRECSDGSFWAVGFFDNIKHLSGLPKWQK